MLGVKIASLTPSHGKKQNKKQHNQQAGKIIFVSTRFGIHSLFFLIKTTNSTFGGRGVLR